MFARPWSTVSPSLMQPGREGTYTVKPPSSLGSKTTITFFLQTKPDGPVGCAARIFLYCITITCQVNLPDMLRQMSRSSSFHLHVLRNQTPSCAMLWQNICDQNPDARARSKNAHGQDRPGCDDTLGRKAARVREGTIRRCGCARVPERVGLDHNLKSSLLKMMIRRQNLAQAALLHNDKRNTIRQVTAQPV